MWRFLSAFSLLFASYGRSPPYVPSFAAQSVFNEFPYAQRHNRRLSSHSQNSPQTTNHDSNSSSHHAPPPAPAPPGPPSTGPPPPKSASRSSADTTASKPPSPQQTKSSSPKKEKRKRKEKKGEEKQREPTKNIKVVYDPETFEYSAVPEIKKSKIKLQDSVVPEIKQSQNNLQDDSNANHASVDTVQHPKDADFSEYEYLRKIVNIDDKLPAFLGSVKPYKAFHMKRERDYIPLKAEQTMDANEDKRIVQYQNKLLSQYTPVARPQLDRDPLFGWYRKLAPVHDWPLDHPDVVHHLNKTVKEIDNEWNKGEFLPKAVKASEQGEKYENGIPKSDTTLATNAGELFPPKKNWLSGEKQPEGQMYGADERLTHLPIPQIGSKGALKNRDNEIFVSDARKDLKGVIGDIQAEISARMSVPDAFDPRDDDELRKLKNSKKRDVVGRAKFTMRETHNAKNTPDTKVMLGNIFHGDGRPKTYSSEGYKIHHDSMRDAVNEGTKNDTRMIMEISNMQGMRELQLDSLHHQEKLVEHIPEFIDASIELKNIELELRSRSDVKERRPVNYFSKLPEDRRNKMMPVSPDMKMNARKHRTNEEIVNDHKKWAKKRGKYAGTKEFLDQTLIVADRDFLESKAPFVYPAIGQLPKHAAQRVRYENRQKVYPKESYVHGPLLIARGPKGHGTRMEYGIDYYYLEPPFDAWKQVFDHPSNMKDDHFKADYAPEIIQAALGYGPNYIVSHTSNNEGYGDAFSFPRNEEGDLLNQRYKAAIKRYNAATDDIRQEFTKAMASDISHQFVEANLEVTHDQDVTIKLAAHPQKGVGTHDQRMAINEMHELGMIRKGTPRYFAEPDNNKRHYFDRPVKYIVDKSIFLEYDRDDHLKNNYYLKDDVTSDHAMRAEMQRVKTENERHKRINKNYGRTDMEIYEDPDYEKLTRHHVKDRILDEFARDNPAHETYFMGDTKNKVSDYIHVTGPALAPSGINPEHSVNLQARQLVHWSKKNAEEKASKNIHKRDVNK